MATLIWMATLAVAGTFAYYGHENACGITFFGGLVLASVAGG